MSLTNYIKDILGLEPEDVRGIEHSFFDAFHYPVYSGELNKMANEKTDSNNKPDFRLSSPVPTNKGDEVFWVNIGSGWKKEKGISIELNALPLTKRMFLFENE